MRIPELILTTLILAGGCTNDDDGGGGGGGGSGDLASIPRSGELRIDVPGGTSSARIGEPAESVELARAAAAMVNEYIDAALTLTDEIAATPPTTDDGTTAIWGPFEDEVGAWRLLATRTAGELEWSLETSEGGAAFVPYVTATASGTGDARSGSIAVDDADGMVVIAYDLAAGTRQIDVSVTTDVTTGFEYRDAADDSGDFEFDAVVGAQDGHVHARWLAGGAGRGELRLHDAELGDFVLVIDECWDAGLARTYYADNVGQSEGDAASCVL